MNETKHETDVDEQLSVPAAYLFASSATAPRRRRASDFTRLLGTAAVFALLGWAASNSPPIDARAAAFFSSLPNWLRALGWIGFSTAAVVSVAMLVVVAIWGGLERGVFRDLAAAALLVVLAGLVAARLVTESWPEFVPEIISTTDNPSYPTLRTALVTVVAGVLMTYVTYPVQRLLTWTIIAAAVSPFILGLTTVTAMSGALALGASSVAVVRWIFGSPEGLPPLDRLRDTLGRAGVEAEGLTYLPSQPGTFGLATATSPEGRRLGIKVYGRDAQTRMRTERAWNALWYRSAGLTPHAGRVEQAQHEALALLTASRSSAVVPELVVTGRDDNGDVLLVTEQPSGLALEDLDADAVDDVMDDAMLRAMWANLLTLHDQARIAHGSIGPQTIVVVDDGVAFAHFDFSSTMPTDQQLAADVVSLLTTTAIFVGEERAIASAAETVDAQRLVAVLPYLHEAVVAPALRRSAKHADVSFGRLRSRLAEFVDVEVPEVIAVRRIKWSDVAMVVFAIIAANALIAQIADVGLDMLFDNLSEASAGWLVVTFMVRLLSYTTNYIGLKAAVTQPLPFAPTTLLQPAKGFVGLVVPSMVGKIGMDIRYLQRLGVSTTTAATLGPLLGVIGTISEFVLVLLSARWIGQEIQTDGLFDFDATGLVAIAAIVVIVGLIVVFAVPRFRNKLVPILKEAFHSIRSIIASPLRFGQIVFSEVLRRLLTAVALGATLAAFGAHVPFAALILVSAGTGLLSGLAPVPGGIGVAEATMSGLLIAVGVDPALSLSIALTHRMITAYLPPVLGFFSMKWLTKEGYL